MSPNPSTLIAPVATAFPKYAGVFNALATLIAGDASVPTTPPVTTPPVVSPGNPAAISVIAGRAVSLTGSGSLCTFDFGDLSAPFNTLRGYNAAHVYDTPGSYVATVTPDGQQPVKTTVTVLADTRPIVTLAPTDDLASAIAKITAPTIVLLPPGVTYDVKTPIPLAVDGVTLRAAPIPPPPSPATPTPSTSPSVPKPAVSQPPIAPPCIRRIAAAGVYSTLIVGAADISIEGITFDSDQPLKTGPSTSSGPAPSTSSGPASSTQAANGKVGIYALNIMGKNLLVRNCAFRNVDDGLHCQAKARGLVAIDCNFTDELRACAAYLDAMQDVTILGLTAAGSICEHIVRLEGSQNVLVSGCDANNHDGKETIAIRMGQCVAVTNNTLRAWARISQGVQAAPAIYCRNILFAGNHFAGLRPIGPLMQVNPGTQTVVFDTNTFDVDASQVAIAVQAPASGLTLSNNILSMVNGATSCRPLVDPFGNPAFTETGTERR